ncbi:Coiled-coil domain-containing protein 81, partial [Merops nubicus]
PGHKELEPLQYCKVAAAASVSRRKAEACIEGTTSLLSRCLSNGENVALVLGDVGVLLVEGSKVAMKFYCPFLERVAGKENLERVGLQVSQLPDAVGSSRVPMASLTSSGRVVVFPEFALPFVPKPPPREPGKA